MVRISAFLHSNQSHSAERVVIPRTSSIFLGKAVEDGLVVGALFVSGNGDKE
jgi:hypothetical protein